MGHSRATLATLATVATLAATTLTAALIATQEQNGTTVTSAQLANPTQAAALAQNAQTSSDPTVTTWQTTISTCVDATNNGLSPYSMECLGDVLTDAYQSQQITQAYLAIARTGEKDPRIIPTCHDSAHLAGRAMYRTGEPIRSLVTDGADPRHVCNEGFIHGALDAFAVDNPTDEQIATVIAACTHQPDETAGLCADGTGHAAWQATSDGAASAAWCAQYPSELLQHSCIGGVIMQVFRPYADGRPAYASDTSINSIVTAVTTVCDDASTIALKPSTVTVCYGRAGGEFGKAPVEPTRIWVGSQTGNPVNGATPVDFDTVTAMWNEAITACSQLPEHARQECKDPVARGVSWTTYGHPELQNRICDTLPEDVQATCRKPAE